MLDLLVDKKISEKSPKQAFAFSNILWLIFQPLMVIGALSVAVIFLSWVKAILIDKKENDLKKIWVCKIDANWWTFCLKDKEVVEIVWNLWIESKVQSSVWYIIISILVIFMMWSLIKVSFKFSQMISWVAEWMYKFSEDLIKAAPVFPVPWWWKVGVGALKKAVEERVIERWFETKQAKQADKITSWINEKLRLWTDITISDKTELLERFKSSMSLPWKFEVFKELIKRWVDRWIIIVQSEHFKDVAYEMLKELDKTGSFKWKLKTKDKKWNFIDKNTYFQDTTKPWVHLIWALANEYKDWKTLPSDVTSFENIQWILKKHQDVNVNQLIKKD